MNRHLGTLVSDYVDRRLDPARLAQLDRHVVFCPACRAKAEQERALLSAMRTAPSADVSAGLREMLLGLATTPGLEADGNTGTLAVPVPLEPTRAFRLPVLEPATPALHRSPFRATVLAGLAASASAAVAWGLAAPAGASPPAPSSSTSASRSSASVVQVALPPASVVSFTGAQSSWPHPASLTERLGR